MTLRSALKQRLAIEAWLKRVWGRPHQGMHAFSCHIQQDFGRSFYFKDWVTVCGSLSTTRRPAEEWPQPLTQFFRARSTILGSNSDPHSHSKIVANEFITRLSAAGDIVTCVAADKLSSA